MRPEGRDLFVLGFESKPSRSSGAFENFPDFCFYQRLAPLEPLKQHLSKAMNHVLIPGESDVGSNIMEKRKCAPEGRDLGMRSRSYGAFRCVRGSFYHSLAPPEPLKQHLSKAMNLVRIPEGLNVGSSGKNMIKKGAPEGRDLL
jgi:hypothetical protein